MFCIPFYIGLLCFIPPKKCLKGNTKSQLKFHLPYGVLPKSLKQYVSASSVCSSRAFFKHVAYRVLWLFFFHLSFMTQCELVTNQVWEPILTVSHS